MSGIEIIMPGEVQRHREPEPPRWSVGQLMASWLAAHNTSQATVSEYRRDVEQYRDWCADMGLDVLTVGLPEVQMYGEHLARIQGAHGRPLAPRTRARKINTVSSFYLHCARAGAIAYNPARDAKRPSYDRRHSPTQSMDEAAARAMLAAVPEFKQRVMSPRALLLALCLMIDLGARVSEVCNVDTSDIGTRRGMRTITFRAKGAKVRVRPVTAQLAPVLDAWRVHRPAVDTAALLVDHRGLRVTRKQLSKLITRLARHVGVAGNITPHSMRHAFNEIAKARGASLESRREALGHASTDTTDLYDHQGKDLATDPAHLVSAATWSPHDWDDEDTDEPADERD